jgi:CubicO group peptidase (beta-lactamase class C family)
MGRVRYDDETRELMSDSIRKVYSITKLFTAVAVMQMVEEGKIRLDQPVGDWLNHFRTPLHQDITVFHLLTHTSGIYADPGYFSEPYGRDWYEWLPGEGDWIRKILAGPLACKPGAEWVYSSAAYAILGEIIGVVSGIPFER